MSVVDSVSKLLVWLRSNPWLALLAVAAILLMPTLWLPSLPKALDTIFPARPADLGATLSALDESFQRYWKDCEEDGDLPEPADDSPAAAEPTDEDLTEASPEENEVPSQDPAESVHTEEQVPTVFERVTITSGPAVPCASSRVREMVVTLDVDVAANADGSADITVASWRSGSFVTEGQRVQITYRVP